MHTFLHGLILYVIKIIISTFSTCEKHFLDLLVDEILVPICSGERSKYLRTNFSHGISNLKLLTANEWGGVAFAMALMVCSKKGYVLFEKVYKQKCQKIRKVQIAECQGEDSSDMSNDDTNCVKEDDSSASDSINKIDSSNDQDSDNDCSSGEEGSNDMEKEHEEIVVDANDVLYVLEMMLLFNVSLIRMDVKFTVQYPRCCIPSKVKFPILLGMVGNCKFFTYHL